VTETTTSGNQIEEELRRDQAESPAAPTDIGVFPVPTELRIDLAIVPGNPTEINEHSGKTYYTEEQEDGHCVS
jgi:hypothetical protein